MANDFLNTVFEDRQLQLEDAIGNHNAGELSDIVEGFVTRTTVLKQEKFQATLDTVVACVAFKRLCGTGVGRWMRTNCPTWDDRKRNRIIEMCKFSAAIFRNWEAIKHNLTNSSMREVDAKDFSLRRLYEARKSSWCRGERRQHPPCEPPPNEPETTKEYDEQKYIAILQKIKDEQILNTIYFNDDQANLIADRIREDLLKICKAGRDSM